MLKKEEPKDTLHQKEGKAGSLFKKRLNYGIGYIVLIVAILVVFIVVNVILEKLPMSVDLTPNKQFSITEETKQILNNLKDDVEIVALYDRVKGEANTQKAEVIRVLDIYDSYSHISVSYVSIDENPNIINDTVGQASAASYSEGDYIVKSGKRSKRIAGNDMFSTEQYTGSFIPITYTTGNQTELKVSTAITYVTRETIPNLYVSTGLGETDRSNYSKILNDASDIMNINVKEVNLSQVDSIPEDADEILFLNPQRDLSAVEYDMLYQWLAFNEGKAFFAFDSDRTGVSYDRFNQLLSELYGMSFNNDIVSDEEAYQIRSAGKASVITASAQKNGPLTNNILEDSYISFDSRSINLLSTAGYFESHPLIQTSSTATGTAYGSGAETKGIATLAACGTYYGNGKDSRVVLMGSSLGLTNSYISEYSNTASEYLFLYSTDWMLGEDTMEGLDIKTKEYSTTLVTANAAQSRWIFILAIILYPLAIIGVGVVIWMRRRHL